MAVGQVSWHLIRIRFVGILDQSSLSEPWILDKVRSGLSCRLGSEEGEPEE